LQSSIFSLGTLGGAYATKDVFCLMPVGVLGVGPAL